MKISGPQPSRFRPGRALPALVRRSGLPLLAACWLALTVFPPSCANTSTAPQGGPKDTIPPILVSTFPLYNTVGYPQKPARKERIVFTFDEYVVLKEATKNIFLSPPLSKPVEAAIRGKSVVFTFPDTLAANTTYSLSTGTAIADNNEGNLMPQYTFSFSTGNAIDSLYTTGTVVDAVTMLPMKQVTVLLYTDHSDSAVFKSLPRAAGRTDDWGFFSVRNLPAGSYRVYALEDLNNNNRYDPNGNERIAFLDSLLVPERIMHPDTLELQSVNVKDTARCLSRRKDFQLYLFREVPGRQVLRNTGRPANRMFFLTFTAPYPQIDTILIDGVAPEELLSQASRTGDSIAFWLNRAEVPDTLKLQVRYMKTDDSLKVLVPATDTVRLAKPKPKMTQDSRGNAVEVVDTVAKFTFTAVPETMEQEGFIFEFDYPLVRSAFDSVRFTVTDPKRQTTEESFTVVQDTANLRRYIMRPEKKFLPGYEYLVKIPRGIFTDVNGLPTDSLDKKVSLPNDEKLSTFKAILTGVHGTYIVELVNEKRDKVLRSYIVREDTELLFPYLKAAKYSLRITEDKNGNGLIDTGSLLEKRQPEKVLLYRMGQQLTDKAYLIDIPERTELEQTIDIAEMFR